MKKLIAVLLVAAISATSALPTTSAFAGDHHRRWSDRGWDDGYDRDRGDRYYRDRDHNYDHGGNKHKKRNAAVIAGIAGLAIGAAIVGSLNQQQRYNGDRVIYDPNY